MNALVKSLIAVGAALSLGACAVVPAGPGYGGYGYGAVYRPPAVVVAPSVSYGYRGGWGGGWGGHRGGWGHHGGWGRR